MKEINFLTVLAILQVFHLGFILHIQPIVGINKTADIIWCIYFTGMLNVFVVLICADVIYSKILKVKE